MMSSTLRYAPPSGMLRHCCCLLKPGATLQPKTQNLHVEVHDYDVVNFVIRPAIRHASTLLLPAEASCNPSALQQLDPAPYGS